MKPLPNLLIVDDLVENIYLLEVILRKVKVRLITALSGAEALEKTKNVELALAIVDVRMPVMDGFELALRLNQDRVGDKVPVIFLTASNFNKTEVFQGYDSGAVDYMSKPIDNHILLCKINIFLDLFNQKQTIILNGLQLKATSDELTRVNSALKKSERRLSDIMYSMADWVWEVDEKGIYTYSSKRGSDLLGVSREEIIGKTMFDFVPSDEVERASVIFSEIMSSKAAIKDFESWNIGKNGERICLLTNGVPIIDEEGNFKGYRGIAKDITERKCAEAALKESEEKFRSVTQSANDAIITSDSSGIITDWNDAAEKIFGYTEFEITGKNLSIILPLRFHQLYLEYIGENLKNKEFETLFKTFEISGLRKNKEEFPLELSLAQWETDSGRYFTGIIRDITRRKRAEEEIKQASNFLDSIIENIPHMIFIKDAKNLRFVRFNKAAENLLGIVKDDILGKNDFDLFPNKQAEVIVAKDREVLDKREMMVIKAESLPTRHDGIRILHTKKVPILDEQGVPKYLLGISEDITEQKMSEQALKISEEKYRTMVNNSPDGILLVNMNGIITEASGIGLELLGADNKEDLVGKNFHAFVPSDENDAIKDVFEKTMNDGICQNFEIKIRKKNKSIFLSEISSTLIQDNQGQPISVMIAIRDISFRKKLETKQIHADRMANLGEMASGIAHEINQPLNIISMVMDRILYETSKNEVIDIEFLKTKSDKIFENIIRIRNIIDHVRAFSRSHENFVLTAFDINKTIENAVSLISEQFKHLGIKLSLELSTEIPPFVGNTYKFEQVIINLLTNAKDAVMEKRTKQQEYSEPSITIKTASHKRTIITEIIDNGSGVNDDIIHNIMLPFFTTKEEGKGTGLGLSICYQIIKEMNGIIDITSDPLIGTTIKVVLNIPNEK